MTNLKTTISAFVCLTLFISIISTAIGATAGGTFATTSNLISGRPVTENVYESAVFGAEVGGVLGLGGGVATASGVLSKAVPKSLVTLKSPSVTTKSTEIGIDKLPPNVQKTISQIRQGKVQHLNPHTFKNLPPKPGSKPLLSFNKDPKYYTTHYTANEPRTMQNRVISGRGGEIYYTPDHYRNAMKVIDDLTK
jgi:hypothetical protein